MKRFLLAGLLIALAQPAFACHRYHTWRYPYPQRCGVVTRVVARPVVVSDTIQLSDMPPAEPPAFDEDVARQRAINQLKVELSALRVGN